MNQDKEIWMQVGGGSKTEQQIASLRQLTLILYILYASCWVLGGVPAIVAIVINYIKREDAAGTLYESHFAWQMRTFWWGLAWAVVGTITALIGVGFIILAVLVIWLIYRMVKGLLFWNDHKPMPL
ncbi:DUF4870 family protein [Comamonas nitrativorans]|uniref:DUF4870 family protein n=1 Tax=Comamonas nitrativorans TaxID=108437 RepID=A0ABV9GV81_9BURK